MTVHTFEKTKDTYSAMWDHALVTQPSNAAKAAARINAPAARAAFEHVQKLTNVPWFMVGVILFRESSLNFSTYLGNGQPLNQVTTIVPKGRGPFKDWYDGAADALTLQGIAGFDPAAWTIERILYWLERYNGQGYFGRTNSPYLWSWTTEYSHGKFVSDGHYDPDFVDPQGGCAAILKTLEAQSVITLTREAAVSAPLQPKVTPMPTPVQPAPQFDIAAVENILASAQQFLPFISGFLPAPLKPFVALLPILIDLVQMAKQIQQSDRSAATIATIVSQHLHTVGDKLKANIPTPQQVQQIAAQTDRAAGAPS